MIRKKRILGRRNHSFNNLRYVGVGKEQNEGHCESRVVIEGRALRHSCAM